jgi:purine nucleosidase
MARLTRERPGDVTVVALGPMTNVALAILLDAEFSHNVAALVLMGGAVHHPGNATYAAEANFNNDPEAAAVVVRSGAPTQLVDLGATSQAVLPLARAQPHDARSLSPIGAVARELLRFYAPVCMAAGAAGAVLHDPLAVALAAVPSLARFIPLSLEVETGGTYARGACVAGFSGLTTRVEAVGDHFDATGMQPQRFNASIAREIDVTGFLDLFLERLELT